MMAYIIGSSLSREKAGYLAYAFTAEYKIQDQADVPRTVLTVRRCTNTLTVTGEVDAASG